MLIALRKALVDYLLGSSGLTALVDNRITWTERPQASALPAVCLHRVAGSPEYSFEGEVGLFSALVQIDCWAKSTAGSSGDTLAVTVGQQVMDRLSSGSASFTQNGVEFQTSFNLRGDDSFERGAGAEILYRCRLDFEFWFAA